MPSSLNHFSCKGGPTLDTADNAEFKYFRTTREPPNRKSVLEHLGANVYSKNLARKMFYSCPQDLSTKKEIGQLRVSVKSKFVQDLEEHKSIGGPGLAHLHERMFLHFINLEEAKTIALPEKAHIVESLASNHSVELAPIHDPPMRSESQKWLEGTNKCKTPMREKFVNRPWAVMEEIGMPGMLSQSTNLNSQASLGSLESQISPLSQNSQ
ncbi:unnamed protein product, partial [Nesidiocoris tenuis]